MLTFVITVLYASCKLNFIYTDDDILLDSNDDKDGDIIIPDDAEKEGAKLNNDICLNPAELCNNTKPFNETEDGK